jgi:hypothetical protein
MNIITLKNYSAVVIKETFERIEDSRTYRHMYDGQCVDYLFFEEENRKCIKFRFYKCGKPYILVINRTQIESIVTAY